MEPVKLTYKTVRNEKDGTDYVSMLVADDAKCSVDVFPDNYCGYGYPYYFRVNLRSPGYTMYYISPSRYREDYLDPRKDYTRDLYGSCHRAFTETSAYIDRSAKRDMENFEAVTLIKKIPYVSNDKNLQKFGPVKEKEAAAEGMELKRYYYCGMVHQYSYINNGRKRIRAYSNVIEAEDLERTEPIPYQIVQSLNNPFMAPIRQLAMQAYTDARYDKQKGWIYTLMHYLDWRVTQAFVLDAPAEDFDRLYKEVFVPTLNRGASITDAVWALFKKKQAQINAENKAVRDKNAAKREEERRVKKQEQDAAAARRQRDRELQDYLRKTQKEISDIRKSSYENTRKTNAKVREIWGDTIRGDTRFVDKYGDEHVIHTYDNYAYKSGSTYVTSDSPLDHDWDWEELEKKKY